MYHIHSEFWGDNLVLTNDHPTNRRRIAQKLDNFMSRSDRELLKTLLGVAPGATASDNYARVQHNTAELGGKRVIETAANIDRATTSDDVADLDTNILSFVSQPANYPRNKGDLGTVAYFGH